MKQVIFLFGMALLSSQLNAQIVSGELVNEGRKLTSEVTFELEESVEGAIYFELAVDRTGKVTGARYLSDKSILISTPAQMRAKNYVMGFKFESGTYYPAFHHCVVKLNLKRKKTE